MRSLYVVADGARARWFEEVRARLVERYVLVNPRRRMLDRELYSESKPGRRDAIVGPNQSFDDHRAAHNREAERRFARAVAEETMARTDVDTNHVVVVAKDSMLGALRNELARFTSRSKVVEVPQNWGRWEAHEIQDGLAELDLMVRRRRATGTD